METTHYSSVVNSKKFKVSLLNEETSETENINFVACNTTGLKNGIYVATNIGAKLVMHIQIFIAVKATFF